VGAHFDSRIPTSERDLERNIGGPKLEGLDDNASGTGVLLELAEAFREVAPTHTITFIAFGAEEIGLHGAHEVINRMTPEERANTLWMVNIDSIVTGDRLYFHAGPKTYAKDPKAGHARDRALAIAAALGITATTTRASMPTTPRAPGAAPTRLHSTLRASRFVNLEATNWELGDKDGYQQTSKSDAFRPAILAPRGHRQPCPPRGLAARRPRDERTATPSASWCRWSRNSPERNPDLLCGRGSAVRAGRPIQPWRTSTMRTAGAALAGLATLSLVAAAAEAATVFTGDVIQGKRVISALDVSDLQPGTRVVQILYDSADPKCDGDGCAETAAEYIE